MKIEKQKLIDILAAVKPGLSSKEVIEQTTHFIFGDGEVYTYNDKISISHETDLNIGDFAIQGEELFKILNKLKEEEIDLEIVKNKLQVTAGKTKAVLNIDNEIKVPMIDIPDDFDPLPANFTHAVKFCLFSVSKNMTKPELTCLNITENQVQSCDNFRLTFHDLDGELQAFLLQGSAAEQLIKYSPVEYVIDNSWIHFANESGVIFSCRTVNYTYPDIDSLSKVEGNDVHLPQSLTESVEKAEILATEEFEQDRFISLTLSKNKLKVKGEGQLGWIEDEIKIDYKGEKSTLKVHPNHFVDILKHLEKAVIGDNSILFLGDEFCHVISLIS